MPVPFSTLNMNGSIVTPICIAELFGCQMIVDPRCPKSEIRLVDKETGHTVGLMYNVGAVSIARENTDGR